MSIEDLRKNDFGTKNAIHEDSKESKMNTESERAKI